MLTYVRHIASWGPKVFLKRLINSSFGLKPIRREIFSAIQRRKILLKLKNEKKTDGESWIPHLTTRTELQGLLGVPALINDPEVLVLQKYGGKGGNTIVEIGCAYGGSSLLFLMSKKISSHLYSIDPFVKDSMGEFQASYELCSGHVKKALTNIEMGERVSDWTLISDYSFNVVKNWVTAIDVIFIDGDHTYEAVKKDFTDWFPLVKVGGFILFHDSCRPEKIESTGYNYGWPGPSRLVRELANNKKVEMIEQVYSISVLRKIND